MHFFLGTLRVKPFHSDGLFHTYSMELSILYFKGLPGMTTSNCMSHDKPPQMKILNMFYILILMHICRLVSNWSAASYTISSNEILRNK